METHSDMAKWEDGSASQAWPAVCAGSIALGTCCRWVQHADACVQDLKSMERSVEDDSQSTALRQELAAKEAQLQVRLKAIVVRGSRLPVYPATRQRPSHLCCMGHTGRQGASETAWRHLTRC